MCGEDKNDLHAYQKAMEEYKANPITFTLEEVELELGLPVPVPPEDCIPPTNKSGSFLCLLHRSTQKKSPE